MLPEGSTSPPSFIDPAQNLPLESVIVSLKRLHGKWVSGSLMASLVPVLGSRNQKPDFAASTKPPRSRTARQPIGSPHV